MGNSGTECRRIRRAGRGQKKREEKRSDGQKGRKIKVKTKEVKKI